MSKQPKSGSRSRRQQGQNGKVLHMPGSGVVGSASLLQRVAALELNLDGLVKTYNANTAVLQDAIRAQDIMAQVLQRVANDLNRAAISGDSALLYTRDGLVNYPAYIEEFYAVAGFAQFLAAWQAWDKATTPVAVEPEREDNVVVFGGTQEAPGSIMTSPAGTVSP